MSGGIPSQGFDRIDGSGSGLLRVVGPAPSETASGDGLVCILDRALRCMTGLGELPGDAASRLSELRGRLAQGRFHLAVLGQFKRGKSTFLNALLGDALLPTAVVPLTAIPTLIHGSDELHVRVLFAKNRPCREARPGTVAEAADFLARYVTETGNPRNHLGVTRVEVGYPGGLFANGVVLIDTPGVGSTFGHNTETTMDFLPQCDAALFLTSADPPMTDVEAAFFEQVRSRIHRVFFVLNKIDYLSAEDRQSVMAFFRSVLAERIGSTDGLHIYPVSAKLGLEAKARGDDDGWRQSGMAAVEEQLIRFLSREKQHVLHQAVAAKTSNVLGQVRMEVNLAIRASELPQTELTRRIALLEKSIGEIQRRRVAAQDVLSGDRRRTIEVVLGLAEAIRKKAREFLLSIADEAIESAENGHEQEAATAALSGAIPTFFRDESERFARAASSQLADALQPHRSELSGLVHTVRQQAAEIFEIQSCSTEVEEKTEFTIDHYWATEKMTASVPVIPPTFVDRFFPAGFRRARIRRRLTEEIESMVNTNVERIRWPVLQKLADTFRAFSSQFDEALDTTVQGIRDALRAATTAREQNAASVAARVAQLRTTEQELSNIQQTLSAELPGSQNAQAEPK